MSEILQFALAKRLKELREERGASQKDVSQFVGISERVYSYYEDGRFPKNEEILIKIALYYDVTIDYLLGHSNSKSGANDTKLRATGLDDESLRILGLEIYNKTTLNKVVQHERFPMLLNLMGLYVSIDRHKVLAHIDNEEFKPPLNKIESELVNTYIDSQIQESDRDSGKLPPALRAETVFFLRLLTQQEPFEPFFFSLLNNILNDIVKDIKAKNDLSQTFSTKPASRSKGGMPNGNSQETDE